MEQIKRQTAGKFWISDLLKINEKLEVKGKSAFRVNIIGNVVFKFMAEDESYVALTLDDGSGSIRIKAWREDIANMKNINVGDLVICVGRIKSYNEEIYINPEVVKKVNLNWELVRKLELLKEYGKPEIVKVEPILEQSCVEEKIVDEDVSESERQKILNLIESIGGDVGARYDDVIRKGGGKAEEIIKELLRDGEVYEPRPNMLRVLD